MATCPHFELHTRFLVPLGGIIFEQPLKRPVTRNTLSIAFVCLYQVQSKLNIIIVSS